MKNKTNFTIPLKVYLLVIFIFSILATVLLCGLSMTRKITDNARERIEKGDQWLISQLCETANYLSDSADNVSASLAFDSDIQTALIDYQYTDNPKINLEQARIRINNSLLNKSRFSPALYDCRNIVLFSNNGDVIGSKEHFNQQSKIDTYDWYPQVEASSGQSIWLPLGSDWNSLVTRNTLSIPIVRKIFSTQSSSNNTLEQIMTVGKELGYLVVYIDVNMFSDIVADDVDVYTKRFFLVDENNRIISCRNKDAIGTHLAYTPMENAEYVMTSKKIESRGWTYICFTERAEVMREAGIVLSVCLMIGMILIVIFSVLGVLISRAIASPIHVLIDNFKKAEHGNISIQKQSHITQFCTLYHAFNQTMEKVYTLANEIYENQIVQKDLVVSIKESRIQALQMQINPHFLYNTLDCINWKAQMDGNKDVAEMIRILGKFFRSNTNIKNEFTTLKDEIDNIELYLTLSKLRFGSRLHCYIDIKDELYSCQIMKLLLQPLVENSIKHGLEIENIEENIWIWCGREDNDLVISVKDDGKGMAPEKLDSLRELWETRDSEYRKTDSIGIYNVMRRLYLCYKEDCTLEVFSKPDKGTEIIISFPMKKTGQN